MDWSNGIKYRFGIEKYVKKYIKEKYIKQINDIREWQKKRQSSASRQKKVMSEKIKGYNIGEEGVGSRYSFAM